MRATRSAIRTSSTDNIDSYQGKSGQNAKAFIQTRSSTRAVIGFGTIDDIDQLAGKARRPPVQLPGQLEITAVLMESLCRGQHRRAGQLHLWHVLELSRRMWTTPCASGPARGSWLTGRKRARITSTSCTLLDGQAITTIPLGAHDALCRTGDQKGRRALSFESAFNRPHEDGAAAGL